MKLSVATFVYMKEGKPTPRKVLVLSKPSDSYLGVQFDGDMEGELHDFLCYLEEKEKMDNYLKDKYNINDTVNYRRFKVEKIRQLTEEKIEI